MALLDEVKSELSNIDGGSPAVQKAQVTSMLYFGRGFRKVQRESSTQIIVQPQFDSMEAAHWLQETIESLYKIPAALKSVDVKTPRGSMRRYAVDVGARAGFALAVRTGMIDPRLNRIVRGLPTDLANGNIAQIKGVWRGAFMSAGVLSDPDKPSALEIICPNEETADSLIAMGQRLGIRAAKHTVRSSVRVHLSDPDAIERLLTMMGASSTVRDWTGKRPDTESHHRANRLANFDDANMRRSAKAAAEAVVKVQHAFDVLGDDIPQNLRAAGQLRIDHPDFSLEELGRAARPQISKDAVAGRIRRLLQRAEKAEQDAAMA